MLDRNLIRRDPEFVRAQCLRKGVNAPVDEFIRVDTEWRRVKSAMDEQKAEMNRVSKSIGQLMASGQKDEAAQAREAAGALKATIQGLEEHERTLVAEL